MVVSFGVALHFAGSLLDLNPEFVIRILTFQNRFATANLYFLESKFYLYDIYLFIK